MGISASVSQSVLEVKFSLWSFGFAGKDPIRIAFDKLDKNGDGSVSLAEMEEGLKLAGLPTPTQEKLKQFFETIDLNRDGRVDFPEFRVFCEKRRAELKFIYDNLEDHLTSTDVANAIQAANMKVSSSQLRTIMTLLNRDKKNNSGTTTSGTASDGTKYRITFEDFCDSLLFVPTINPEAVFEAIIDHVPIDVAQSEYAFPKSSPTAVPTASTDHKTGAGDTKVKSNWEMIERSAIEIGQQLYYGGVAGVVSRTATAPIDRLKVMAQAGAPGSKSLSMAAACRHVYTTAGLRGFFRGNLTNCVKIGPETACKFIAFDKCKAMVAQDAGNVTMGERFVAGGLAGAITQTAIYPLEIVKTRMNVAAPGTYTSILHCLRSISREAGVSALYKGCATSVAGSIPYAGIDLMTNSLLKEYGTAYYKSVGQEPGVAVVIVSGMLSSSVAMVITYPINLVRTRLQTSGMPGAVHYAGVGDCLKRTVAADGLLGLYKGVLPNMFKVIPSASISYTVYDLLKNYSRPAEQTPAKAKTR